MERRKLIVAATQVRADEKTLLCHVGKEGWAFLEKISVFSAPRAITELGKMTRSLVNRSINNKTTLLMFRITESHQSVRSPLVHHSYFI